MKRFLTESAKPLLALLVFLIMQVLAGVAMVCIGQRLDMRRSMAICLGLANLGTLLAVWGIFRRSAPMDGASAALGWKEHLLALVGCCFGVVALDFCAEILDLPDMMVDIFIKLGSDPWGIVSIAIIGPVAEEVLFRWGIMRHYMPGGAWRAILISALAFGIIHMNPAQVPFAAAMGVMLGILYWRSGSIAWPIALHILNNSLACVQILLLGDKVKEFSIIEAMGGMAIGSMTALVFAAISVSLLWRYATIE